MAEFKIVARPWQPQDLIDDLQMMIDEEPDSITNDRRTTLCMARDYLKDFFAKDVVEVVRCKDCVYSKNGNCTKGEEYDDTRYRPDYFCADGYRGDNDD